LEKIALLSASAGAYDHSARTFEQLGTTALESNLLKFGAKKHFMHSGFCYLARGDVVAARMAYDRYAQMDLSFHGSREAKVLDEVIVAYEGNDSDAFSTALSDYDRVCTLNAWETSILLRIKKTIEETAAAPPDLR
jgi:alpha-soluble NSF attachment protein